MDDGMSSENNILQTMKWLQRKAMLLWEPCYLFIKQNQKQIPPTKKQIRNKTPNPWFLEYSQTYLN